jgi:lysophospholipase
MPDCRVIVYPQSRHEILMERDDIRAAFWRDADGFLAPLAP